MAPQKLHVQVITSRKCLLAVDATEVILPAFDGEVGILALHESFVGTLGIGSLKVVADEASYWFAVCEGIFEVESSNITILARDGIEADQIDPPAIKEELHPLEASLGQANSFEAEYKSLKTKIDYLHAMLNTQQRSSRA